MLSLVLSILDETIGYTQPYTKFALQTVIKIDNMFVNNDLLINNLLCPVLRHVSVYFSIVWAYMSKVLMRNCF